MMTEKRGSVFTLSIIMLCLFFLFPVAKIGAQEQQENAQAPQQQLEQKDYRPYPQPDSGYVSDHADVLTVDQEEEIERWLWQVESRTEVEIIVVIIESMGAYPNTANGSIEAFATALFDTYGIGNMPKNDGILLLVSIKDRKARIELGKYYGHGRDGDAERIMQKTLIPHFKKEQYAAGIRAGVKDLMTEFADVRVGFPWSLIFIPLGMAVVAGTAFSLFRQGKRGWGWVLVGIFFVLGLVLLRIIVGILQQMPIDHSSGWSSGGIGGFGGGSSGGGGASGSW